MSKQKEMAELLRQLSDALENGTITDGALAQYDVAAELQDVIGELEYYEQTK